MAQYRQSGSDRYALRGHDLHNGNGASDHVSIGIRAQHKQSRARRSSKGSRISVGAVVLILSLVLTVTVFAYNYISGDSEINTYHAQDDDSKDELDFLTNVTRIDKSKVLEFGQGSGVHGGDSRYWERDDRRRDEDYNEEALEHSTMSTRDGSIDKSRVVVKGKNDNEKIFFDNSIKGSGGRGSGLYNEAGRDELKIYEAEYEASLKNVGQSINEHGDRNKLFDDAGFGMHNEEMDADDEYDDGIDSHDARMVEDDDNGHENGDISNVAKSHDSSDSISAGTKDGNIVEEVDESSSVSSSLNSQNSRHVLREEPQLDECRKSSVKTKAAIRCSSCEMKLLNSTAQLVEPLESRKFARFSLQYTAVEEKPNGQEHWEPRFSGHQSLQEREESFLAHDQKINCAFVKSPKGYPSTGFDLAEDDVRYISSCHIAVISCIFGNSDRLRSPAGKTISRLSRKNVCFVMFMDEITLQTLSSERQMPDRMGFIGLWKTVVVKNLPYTDMRRVGKIPKLLAHRLFPSARYSIWLDSKLRLQLDPLLILEYFLWRKGHEYAISNHYDRHCVWEEVAQNKKLNKYNHSIIDQQFAFYQADGLKRFNASDPNKLLPSNVPEGSFIVRAHTPMSNLFSCLWFNEVDRFTPRDQLSFAYTYQKLRRVNPGKPFHLNMFKDCERRAIAKLFRHRSEEKRNILQAAAE
uniref:TOD1/MUCI70 glycosyltransferase-like domain-containing protein n=1 Tax=Vitis vinifera TaxID=29760 RepID=A5BHD2_VITVI|nr:hypothetical protein VITISV_029506 [Vitis vinifera]